MFVPWFLGVGFYDCLVRVVWWLSCFVVAVGLLFWLWLGMIVLVLRLV